MTLILSLDGQSLVRRFSDGGLGVALRAPEGTAIEDALADWSQRYSQAVAAGIEPAIRKIGSEMFAWLDQGGALDGWLAGPARHLEIVVEPTQSGALADAMLAAPWEVLCREGTFLAEDGALFTVARRCGGAGDAVEARHKDLSLMFMAAAPEGDDGLDFEREEASILQATAPKGDRKPLAHVQVEESGALEFLHERLTLDGPFEALHISCHGTIERREDRSVPVLLLETDAGGTDLVDPRRLLEDMHTVPPLMFLSACRTAERGKADGAGGLPRREGYRRDGLSEGQAPFVGGPATDFDDDQRRDGGEAGQRGPAPDLADPYVRQLARFVPNLLGWDGSVYDLDATAFAEAFYGAIARGDTVPMAAARARQAVLQLRAKDPRLGRHWHLARVYLGPGGGTAICDPAKKPRPTQPPAETVFLDDEAKLVPVAGAQAFVGRRRAIQRVIKAYRDGQRGVVIHGMGNLGKSSLAARVAGRLRRHKTVAVFGSATERTIFAALVRAGRQIAAGMAKDPRKEFREELKEMEQAVAEDVSEFGDMVQTLLTQYFNDQPVLLVLDDFEQSLMTPRQGGGPVVPEGDRLRAMQALLTAFREADTQSRLLITTRFDFAVLDETGADLAARLARVPLAPMGPRERLKQVQAKARAQDQEALATSELASRALAAAAGNPGLQDALTKPILAGQVAEAEAAIATITTFRKSGKRPPEGADVGDFFQRMAFETYTGALAPAEQTVLGAATLFSEGLPVPRAALFAAASARGVAAPEAALDRLLALGLLDDFGPMAGWRDMETVPHLAANPLARPLPETLGTALTEADRPSLAAATLPALATAWQDAEDDFPRDARGLEAAVLALQAEPTDPALLDSAAKAAVIFLYDLSHNARAALALGQAVLARLEGLGAAPGPILAGKLVNAATRLGETALAGRLINAALARNDLPDRDRGRFLGLSGDRQKARGDLEAAEESYQKALALFVALGDNNQRAVTKSKIAGILQARGDLDGALRVLETELLPVYEALGDKRSIAVTKGQIADILQARGDLDGALRIRETEVLPVFEALGDKRSIAVTKGQIADILQIRGDLEGALRIRETEELPVYEALGDKRSIAVTKGQIADILQARGDLDGALAMHSERLPVAREMGDQDGIAHIQFSCAQIRFSRGDHETGGFQTIYEELAEAFAAAEKVQRPDAIGAIGTLLGQVLAMGRQRDQALQVLAAAAGAWERIGQTENVQDTRRLMAQLEGTDP